MDRKIGVVLEGGGTKGAYQIGALMALKEEGIPIHGITGTSIGAINGAFVAMDRLDELYEIYKNIRPSSIIDTEEDVLKLLSQEKLSLFDFFHIANRAIRSKGLDVKPLRTMLEAEIDEQIMRQGSMHYGLVYVDLKNRKSFEVLLEEIPQGHLVECIMASAYLPFFQQEKLEYLDGGIHNAIPLDLLLRSDTYDHVYVIRTEAPGRKQSLKREVSMDVIRPTSDTGPLLQFDPERTQENIQMGYYDMLRVLRGYSGKWYTIADAKKNFFFKLMIHVKKNDIVKSAMRLGLNRKKDPRRILFEDMVELMEGLLDCNKKDSYEDLGLRLFESIALENEIDRYRIYTFDEFIQKVRGVLQENIISDIKFLEQVKVFLAQKVGLSLGETTEVLMELAKLLLGGMSE